MRTRVTAVLVATHGGEWIDRTLEGIAAQTRPIDRVIAVVNGGSEALAKRISDSGAAQRIVSTMQVLPFGAAVQQGVSVIPVAEAPVAHPSDGAPRPAGPGDTIELVGEWLWLLTEDSAPEPEALAQILSTVQRAPSVAIAGPKLVDWDRPDRIIELGQSLTQNGRRWLLRRQERDQQQYDHLQDVLGVGPVGMLVRADVWQQLDGFDPAYPVYDDGLDLSVRARLSGYRVVVAPTSRVRFARRGVAGPRIERSRRVLRAAHRQARTAELHREISYAPAILACVMWLGLPLVALARMAWVLIREQPGNLWAEFAAALRVFFRPAALIRSRRRVKRANAVGWSSVRPLRVDRKAVRTARMIDREAILAAQGRQREELHFISGGGLAVLLVCSLAAIALCWWAIPQTSLAGGALAPLSPIGELWEHTRTLDGVPADPFNWVLALLGTITFWNPSHAVVLVLLAAVPLASLGGWLWAAGLTSSVAGRALLSVAWAFSPVLLGSIAAGRLPTLILAIVLPWLLLAASRCRESWSWAGLTSLLAAVALACAPILLPAALTLLIAGLLASPRGFARVLSTAIAPLALFTPLLLAVVRGYDPLRLLLDPGIVTVFTPSNTWQLLVGFPEYGLAGWGDIFAALGVSGAPVSALVGVLLLPIVLLAALGLITGRVRVTVLHALLGGLGLLTAVAAARVQLLGVGAEAATIWTGSGLAVYWIALLGLAAIGATALRRAAAPVVAVGTAAALIAVAPLAVALSTSNTPLVAGDAQMPALVQAAGAQDPALRTVVLTPVGEGAVRAQLVTGPGDRLDRLRTAATPSTPTEQDAWIAELVGALASTGDSTRAQQQVLEHGVSFVLLRVSGESGERSQLQAALEQHAVLENAGQTSHGLLWRVTGAESVAAGADTNLGDWFMGATARTIWVVQLLVLLAMVLLALPTGEIVERPERRRKGGERAKAAEPLDAAADSTGNGGAR